MNQRLQRGLQNAELLHYLISNQVEILQIWENDKSPSHHLPQHFIKQHLPRIP